MNNEPDSNRRDESRDLQWLAVRTKSRSERVAALAIGERGLECFLPTHRSKRMWSDRTTTLNLPLFPGYLFCLCDPAKRRPVLEAPGVMHIVGIGNSPLPVDAEEIRAIRTAVDSGLELRPWQYLQSGDKVMIEKGPLRGVHGILMRLRNEDRLVVSISLLQRAVSVEIERGWIRPLEQRAAKSLAI